MINSDGGLSWHKPNNEEGRKRLAAKMKHLATV